MRGAREAPAPRDSLNFRRAFLLSRNEFESGTFTIVLHATSFFTYVSVIYGANFSFNFFNNCDRQKRFSQNERRRADPQNLASNFLIFASGLSYDLSKFSDDFTPFFRL